MKENTKETAKNYTIPMSELADNAIKNYEQALRTGLKMQEEAGKWWTSMVNQTTLAQDWQKRLTNMTSLTPMAQRRMEEVITLMEKNTKAGADLVKKAVDAAQTPSITDSHAKWMDFWTSSMGAMRTNTETLSHIGAKATDSWIEFVRKNTETAEMRVPKVA